MFKHLAVAIALVLSTSATLAEDFYMKSAGAWAVVGLAATANDPARCIIHTKWKDGIKDSFVVIKDLSDDELYLVMNTPDIVYSANDNNQVFGMLEFKKLDEELSYKATATFQLRSKNTIHIRHIEEESFLNYFARYDIINIIIPGNNRNLDANLKGSEKIPALLNECASLHKNIKSSPTKKKKISL